MWQWKGGKVLVADCTENALPMECALPLWERGALAAVFYCEESVAAHVPLAPVTLSRWKLAGHAEVANRCQNLAGCFRRLTPQ